MSNQFDWAAEAAEQRRMRAQAMAKALREHQGQPRFGGTKMALSSGPSVKRHGPADGAYAQPYGGQALDSAHD